jgi:hypothetical protein
MEEFSWTVAEAFKHSRTELVQYKSILCILPTVFSVTAKPLLMADANNKIVSSKY